MSPGKLGPRFADAFRFALEVHGGDLRKGTDLPYIGHLLGVASIVIDAGASEDAAVAALLHDTLEDHPAEVTEEQLTERFGRAATAIVVACSDGDRDEPRTAATWGRRKQDYLDHLASASNDALLVSLADKLHNLRALLLDLAADGVGTLSRFSASSEELVWYYTELAAIFTSSPPHRCQALVDEFVIQTTRFGQIVGSRPVP